jgi:hypothetical protein
MALMTSSFPLPLGEGEGEGLHGHSAALLTAAILRGKGIKIIRRQHSAD